MTKEVYKENIFCLMTKKITWGQNFNILGVYWKIQFLGGLGSRKSNIEEGIA